MKGKYLNIDQHHSIIRMSGHISEIANPLSEFGIIHFFHERIYDDLSRISLTNNPDWLIHFFQKQYYQYHNPKMGRFSGNRTKPEVGESLWLNLLDHVFEDARQNFNIDNGISIIEEGAGFLDFFLFGSTPDNLGINNFYLTNFDILEHFILYYKEKSRPILKKALPSRFFPDSEEPGEKIHIGDSNDQKKRGAFLKSTPIRKYFIFPKNEAHYLTSREYECIKLLSLGKSQKESAHLIGISHRTLTSYLENAKARLNLYSTTALIDLAFGPGAHSSRQS